ncbi:MAG: MotA/TolQ/ExbB proton channel family protein [Myxococcota bacterium]|nr:MotA/TolQ/ExbB proton channel family protein [Myxococcota bacterium]
MEGFGATWDAVVSIWRSGGAVMPPLFILAVLLYSQAFQLIFYVRRVGLDPRSEMNWWDWVRTPERAEGRVADIVRYTQTDVDSVEEVRNRFDEIRLVTLALVDRRAKFVATLVSAAPLMGLLGTVMGMLRTFLGISSSAGEETAGVIAGGISEALVTTQTGLAIALPGLFVVMIIQRQRHALEAQLARLESLTLSHIDFLPGEGRSAGAH